MYHYETSNQDLKNTKQTMQKQKPMKMLHSWIPFKAMPSEGHTGAGQT